jgi:hypothetical protein
MKEPGTEGGVYLYTHWGGYELPARVQRTLQRKQRWSDHSYLARMLFTDMLDGDRGETGFGISLRMCDNEYPIILVDCANQKIGFAQPCYEADPVFRDGATWTFTEYIALSQEQLNEAFNEAPSR